MSEVVSYIITFSIITVMIGLLYTAGFVSMSQLQTGNQMQNAEGVFFAMADSFGELQEGQAPKRAGAVDLDVGASIGVANETRVDVVVNGPDVSERFDTHTLVYRLDDRAVAYETGAVFRGNREGAAMVREPAGMFCSNETNASMISVVTLTTSGSQSVAAGTATVTGVQRSTTLLFPTSRTPATPVDNVTVNVSSPYGEAWNRHLASSGGWTDPDGDGTFVCEDVDQVFLRHTVIEVRIAN